MIVGKNLFDQQVKNNIKTYNSILKNMAVQGEDYTTGCLLFYRYFNEHYKTIAIDLSKQQALDADLEAVQ